MLFGGCESNNYSFTVTIVSSTKLVNTEHFNLKANIKSRLINTFLLMLYESCKIPWTKTLVAVKFLRSKNIYMIYKCYIINTISSCTITKILPVLCHKVNHGSKPDS